MMRGLCSDAAHGATEFTDAYTLGAALSRLDQTRGFLASFRELTERVRGRLLAADLRSIGNTGWEMQNLGFHNIPIVVEGTLLKQDYQLRQVEYELARLRRARGEVAEEDLERAKNAYREATERFQSFWNTRRYAD